MPNNDPKFHQIEILIGVGNLINELFKIFKIILVLKYVLFINILIGEEEIWIYSKYL